MSICGKYDLYDHICMKKTYPSNPDNPNSPLVSDIMECFDVFKEETGGIIYQWVKTEVNIFNQHLVEKKCNGFKVITHKEMKEDKRYKNNKREAVSYTYEYYGKEYKTLKELNKKGVYINKEIKFDNIVELIPYFPYIIAACSYSNGEACVYISSESYMDKRYKEDIKYGNDGDYWNHYYRKTLADITKDIILKYFSDYKERTIKEELEVIKENDKYVIHTSKDIDYNFEAKVDEDNKDKIVCYSLTPKYIDKNTLDVSDTYFDIEKRDKIVVKYVYKGNTRCLK